MRAFWSVVVAAASLVGAVALLAAQAIFPVSMARGLDTRDSNCAVPAGYAIALNNFDLSSGTLLKRGGSLRQNTTAIASSQEVWSLFHAVSSAGTHVRLAQCGDTLYRASGATWNTTTQLKDFGTEAWSWSYAMLEDKVVVVTGDGTNVVYNITADTTEILGASGTSYPANCTIAVAHHDRVWLAGFQATLTVNDVAYSEIAAPHDFLASSVFKIDDPREIKAMASFADALWIFTDKTISVLRDPARSPTLFSQRLVNARYGCIGNHALEVVGNYLYFVDPIMGVCRMDGVGNVQPVGLAVLPDFRNIKVSLWPFVQMRYNENRRQLWIAVAYDTSSVNDRVYVAFLDRWGQDPVSGTLQPAWAIYDLRAQSLEMGASSTGVERFIFGDDLGYVYAADWATRQDYVPAAVAAGTTDGATSTTTVEDSSASFPTTGDGLAGAYCTISHATGAVETLRISSNNATQLTVATASENILSGDTYYVGAIDAVAQSAFYSTGTPFADQNVNTLAMLIAPQTHGLSFTASWFSDCGTTAVASQSLGETDAVVKWPIRSWAGSLISVKVRARWAQDDFEVIQMGLLGGAQEESPWR